MPTTLLSADVKQRLVSLAGNRMRTGWGATDRQPEYRTQPQNREERVTGRSP
jgi:hypothetical protein